MFTRYKEIIDGLRHQGKTFKIAKTVNKPLRELFEKWNHVTTTIRETQRIMPPTIDEPIGTLMALKQNVLMKKKIIKVRNQLP